MKAKERRTFNRQLFAAAGAAWAAMALGGPLAQTAWVVLGLILLIAYTAADDAHDAAQAVWVERETRVEEIRRAREQPYPKAANEAQAQRTRIAAARAAGSEVFVVLSPDGDYTVARAPDGTERRL